MSTSGGSSGGPPAGSYIPVADSAGVTVDTTTYDNTVTGTGKLTTLIFPVDTVGFAFALEGDAFPRLLMLSDITDGMYMGNGQFDAYDQGAEIFYRGNAADGSDSQVGTFSNAGTVVAKGRLDITNGDVNVHGSGKGINVQDNGGAPGARQGLASLVDGTVDVDTAAVVANSRTFITPIGSPPAGMLYVALITPGVGFTITSTDPSDEIQVMWEVFNPAT